MSCVVCIGLQTSASPRWEYHQQHDALIAAETTIIRRLLYEQYYCKRGDSKCQDFYSDIFNETKNRLHRVAGEERAAYSFFVGGDYIDRKEV